MQHEYWRQASDGMEGIDWGKLQSKQIVPPWIPEPMKDYVDREFLQQRPPSLEDRGRVGYESQGDFSQFTFLGSKFNNQ